MSKFALGRGLGAILGEVEESYLNEAQKGRESVREIPIEKIIPNPFQPRKVFDPQLISELSQSIKHHGLLQPVIVIREGDGYMLIAGERRYRATQLLGEQNIKAIVADIDKDRIRELALIENIQRENLNAIELAQSLRELIDEHGLTHDELSHTLKKSRSFITNTLRLLGLSDYTKEYILDARVTQGHAKVLVGLSEVEQKTIIDSIVGQKLSVRDTENLVASIKKRTKIRAVPTRKNVQKLDFKKLSTALLGYDIKVESSSDKLVLTFKDQSSVEKFANRLHS